MGYWYRRAFAIVLLVQFAGQPAVSAVCVAACEPTPASTNAAPHHMTTAACHDDDASGMQVKAAGMSACGDHDRAMDDRSAAVTANRDSLADRLAAARSLPMPLHLGAPGVAVPPGAHPASAPPSTKSTVLVVLRI